MNLAKDRLSFDKKNKYMDLLISSGEHRLAQLELIGVYNNESAVMLLKEDKSVINVKGVRRILRS